MGLLVIGGLLKGVHVVTDLFLSDAFEALINFLELMSLTMGCILAAVKVWSLIVTTYKKYKKE